MRAIVKVAYFDDLGLHKVGDVVEVKALKPFHEAIEEKPEEVKPVTETVEVKPTKKKTTKKSIKKTVKKG